MPSHSGASVHSGSIHTLGNQIGTKMRYIAHLGQPVIEINLNDSDGAQNGYVVSYSTMDTIEGSVTITAPHDSRFEDIDIAFVGTSQVFVDRLTTTPSMTGRTEANHRFLTLRQPIDENDFPSPRIFTAGKTYTFPFTFTVPPQLLPKACTHNVVSDYVRDMHLMLPPSMGDPDLAGFGKSLLDDLAPEMSKIVYGIKVRIAYRREPEGSLGIMAEKMKKIRVKPAFDEQPPVNIDSNSQYRARHEKSIKKGLFKGKLGTLTAQTLQPKPLVIPGARTYNNTPIATMAKILVRFDPADESNAPPKLNSLSTKIKVSTYFASAPRDSIPMRSDLAYDFSQGVYSEHVNLSNLCIASAQWEKHDSNSVATAESLLRRDSGISDCSTATADSVFATGIPRPSKDYKKGTFYTTSILVPVSLPSNKNFLPTFHSCLISRTYTLSMQFSAHSPGPSVNDPSLSLKVPVQICADGSESGLENARARSVEAGVMQEAAHMFTPRSVARPGLAERTRYSVESRDELPPEYAAPVPARYRARVTVVG